MEQLDRAHDLHKERPRDCVCLEIAGAWNGRSRVGSIECQVEWGWTGLGSLGHRISVLLVIAKFLLTARIFAEYQL